VSVCACVLGVPPPPPRSLAKESLSSALNRPLPPCALSILHQAVIYAPARTPSQQGMSNTATSLGKGGAWRIEFETKPK
jgi:hypothetical protein